MINREPALTMAIQHISQRNVFSYLYFSNATLIRPINSNMISMLAPMLVDNVSASGRTLQLVMNRECLLTFQQPHISDLIQSRLYTELCAFVVYSEVIARVDCSDENDVPMLFCCSPAAARNKHAFFLVCQYVITHTLPSYTYDLNIQSCLKHRKFRCGGCHVDLWFNLGNYKLS